MEPAIWREVVVGKNSAIWRVLSHDDRIRSRFQIALGHGDIANERFGPNDRLWVFSYSRKGSENRAFLERLKSAGASNIIYFSSATTNVTEITSCYNYPSVKKDAEVFARDKLGAYVVSLGVLFEALDDLPAGTTIATHFDDLIRFMLSPTWPADTKQRVLLFQPVKRPFSTRLEEVTFNMYARAINATGRWPCVLRPFDFLCRALGYRWYGYVYLSNKAWLSTTSSSDQGLQP